MWSSSASSPNPSVSSLAAVPWASKLQSAYRSNYDDKSLKGSDAIQMALASVKSNGTPKIQQIVFQEFLPSDQRVLLFSAATRNAELMQVVKFSQSHEISWQFPKTRESVILTGRLFIVCCDSLSHRFGSGPKNISIPDSYSSQDDFWDATRTRLWKQLVPTYRASFTWPASGEIKGPGPKSQEWSAYRDIGSVKPAGPVITTGFKYLKLDALDDSNDGKAKSPSSVNEEYRYAHNSALDNFCILVFKASRVDFTTPGSAAAAPTRTVYTSNKDGAWLIEEINP